MESDVERHVASKADAAHSNGALKPSSAVPFLLQHRVSLALLAWIALLAGLFATGFVSSIIKRDAELHDRQGRSFISDNPTAAAEFSAIASEKDNAWIIALFGGTAASILLFLLLLSRFRTHQQATRMADILTTKLRRSEHDLREAQSIAGLGSYILDVRTGSWTSSPVLDLIFGIGDDFDRSFEGWVGLIHPEDREVMAAYFSQEVLDRGRRFNREYRIIRRSDGAERWVYGLGKLTFDEEHRPITMHGTITDITERKETELALKLSEERMRAIIHASPVPMALNDVSGNITFVNAAFVETFGYTLDEISLISEWFDRAYPDSQYRQFVTDTWQTKLEASRRDGTPFVPMEVQVRAKDGKVRTVLAHAAILEPSFRGVHLVVLYDITDRKQAEERIRSLAYYDPLTGLPNRHMFNDRLSHALSVSKRSSRYGAVMFLDLDNFKPLNDTRGHDVGDLLLVEVARRITSCLREVDTVARFGGDEFVVIVSELSTDYATSSSQAKVIAEKIRTVLAKPYTLTLPEAQGWEEDVVTHTCTVSIGVVLFRNHEAPQEDLLKLSDIAMYRAKELGRNRVFFSDSMDACGPSEST